MIQLARHLPAEGARRVFNWFGTTSYAQNGEDLLICSLLGWPTTGYFVDVGCHHPIRHSNTFTLYLQGLCGLAIDANGEFATEFESIRPLDTFVSACVGSEEGTAEFKVFVDRALSSIAGRKISGISDAQYRLERVEHLPIRRLDDVLSEARAPHDFDLLSIDVEEHDFSVLKSVNLEIFHPRLVVIELHDVDVGRIADHEVSRHLAGYGYKPVACQKSNAFYLR
ncbi:MAG: FkbM family methyltransferase [Hyphomicrobium sp.]